jgi:L-aspartate oxidase
MLAEGTDHQYLDLRHLPAEKMHVRFPTISAACREQGLDLARDLLPIAPAAHYCMGGVMTDTHGCTTLPGLYAVGEVAYTGVHGANRLASNSLLEGLVYGIRLASYLSQKDMEAVSGLRANTSFIHYEDVSPIKVLPFGNAYELTTQQVKYSLREVMWQYVSLSRDQEGLLEAQRRVQVLRSCLLFTSASAQQKQTMVSLEWSETLNMLQVASIVIAAALTRCESRGSHWRLDYQHTDASLAGHHYAFQRSNSDPDGLEKRNEEVAYHA